MLGEVAPLLVPQFDQALIALGALAGLLFVLGLLYFLDAFSRAIFGAAESSVSWIPYLGKVIARPLVRTEQKISHELGKAERQIDALAGRYFNALAKLVVWVVDEIKSHAYLLLAFSVLGLTGAVAEWIREHFASIRHAVSSLRSQVVSTTHTVTHVVTKQIVRVERTTVVRTKAVSSTVAHVVTQDIPNLRARTKALEDDLAKLADRVKAAGKAIPTAVVTAVALAALAKIGAGWLKCSNWRRIGSAGCRLPINLLEDLLALVADFAILADICQVVGWLEGGLKEVEPVLVDFTKGLDKALCHGDYAPGVTLTVPTLYTPPNPSDAPLELSV